LQPDVEAIISHDRFGESAAKPGLVGIVLLVVAVGSQTLEEQKKIPV
jgi:hypothetical protein